MIRRKPELRDDVTLVVEPGRLRFIDERSREIPTGLPQGKWASLPDVDSTMSFLNWLDVRFSREAA